MLQQGSTNAPINYGGLNVGTSQWNAPIPIFWGMRRLSQNAIWYGDFSSKPANGKGKGGSAKDQQQTYFAAVACGLCEGVVDSFQNIWAAGSTTTTTNLSGLNLTAFYGSAGQAPWSYLTTNHPTQALSYSQLAYVANPHMALGESASIPDNGFECVRTALFAGSYVDVQPTGGWINPSTHAQSPAQDVLISDCIADLLTSTQYGFDFSSVDLDATSLAQFRAYQQAQGLFFSPLLVSQEKVTEILDRWAQLSNAWIYWTGTAIQFVPLGDVALSANGATYTPWTDVAYALGPGDFIAPGGADEGPIKVTRTDPADCHNRFVLNFSDRTLAYIDNPVEWKDDFLVSRYGLRDDSSTQADEICDPAVAHIAVQLFGKRGAYIRNTYTFKTSYFFILCLPGTILTLTEPNIGLNAVRVRVTHVAEDENDQLSFTCEEYPGTVGVYVPPITSVAAAPAQTPNLYVAPPSVNTPAIVEPSSAFAGGTPRLIIAASGGTNWGGCTVAVSFDGVDYSQVGEITAPARQGLLTAALSAFSGANPDAAHTLAVDCTESLGAPTTVTHADAQAYRTLSLVAAQPTLSGGAYIVPAGELLAFGAAAATGTYAANLTYLERGLYGSSPAAHGVGDQFTLLNVAGTDATSVSYPLPAQYIGQPVYLKLCSFNVFGNSLQDPSIVREYIYTPTGAGYGGGSGGNPLAPTGLAVAPANPGQVALSWSANPATDNVTDYLLYRAAGAGASFGSASLVWTGASLGYTDTPGAGPFTYFLEARNAIGVSAPTAGVNVTVASAASGTATSLITVSTASIALGTPPALVWYVDLTNSSTGAVALELPAAPQVGQVVQITDAAGNAGNYAVTIETSAGAPLTPAASININYGWFRARWNGSVWLQA